MQSFLKTPNGVLDFKFDLRAATNQADSELTDYLGTTETLTSASIIADTGITVDSSSLTDTNSSVTTWLSGGTALTDYEITCRFTTSGSRTDERSIKILVRER